MALAEAGNAAIEQILAVIRRIPRGRITTYGRVAERAGLPRRARLVATALRKADDPELPWFRVMGAGGRIVFPKGSPGFQRQCERLHAEGVIVNSGRVSLDEFGWHADDAAHDLPLLDP